jgi:choline kinase
MELVILAAGMGSRFGGLKQIEPIDEYNNFIIDYSIYDAIEAGFDCVTFIIKEEMYEDFKETIGKRIESKIKVKYALQSYIQFHFMIQNFYTKVKHKDVTIICSNSSPVGDGSAPFPPRIVLTHGLHTPHGS